MLVACHQGMQESQASTEQFPRLLKKWDTMADLFHLDRTKADLFLDSFGRAMVSLNFEVPFSVFRQASLYPNDANAPHLRDALSTCFHQGPLHTTYP